MTLLRVRLEPIDPLLFGDNRSARLGESHALGDQDPSPVTVYGAIGGRIAACRNATGPQDWSHAEPVLGPFEPRLDVSSEQRSELCGYALCDLDDRAWFPKPLHLRVARTGKHWLALPALRPADAPGLSSLRSARPLQPVEAAAPDLDEDETDLLVNETFLERGLTSEGLPPNLGSLLREKTDLYRPEPRLGLAMDNESNVAVEGRLFGRPYRRFRSAVGDGQRMWRSAGFVAWYRVLEEPASGEWDGLGFLGGDRRRVRLSFSNENGGPPLGGLLQRVLAAAETRAGAGPFAYLLTPAVAPVDGVSLEDRAAVASAVGRPLTISGWEARSRKPGPRPIRTLVPAGSVFFFEWTAAEQSDASARRQWIERHWLSPLSATYRNTGFGRMLVGLWS